MKKLFKKIIASCFALSLLIVPSVNAFALDPIAPQNYFHYGFENGYILGIPAGTTKSKLYSELKKQSIINEVEIKSSSGAALSNSTIVGTNCQVTIYTIENGTTSNTFRTVIYGDVNGDGAVNANDKVNLRAHLVGNLTLTGAYAKAANVNGSSSIDQLDLTELTNMIVSVNNAYFLLNTDFDRSESFSFPDSLFNYSGYSVLRESDQTKDHVLTKLKNSTIFASRGHGEIDRIALFNSMLWRSDILALPSNALSGNRLVYYGACLTGEGGSTASNLVNATYDRGAKTVIGFKTTVTSGPTNIWTQQFLKSVSNGCMIKDAVLQADYTVLHSVYTTYTENRQRTVRGLSSQMLPQPINIRFSKYTYAEYLAGNSTSNSQQNLIKSQNGNFEGFVNTLSADSEMAKKTLSKEAIGRIAQSEAAKHVDISKYNLYDFSFVEDTGVYCIIYNRVINETATDDIVFFMIEPDGKIVASGYKNNGAFDSFDFSKIKTENVLNKVCEKAKKDCGQVFTASKVSKNIHYSFLAVDDNNNFVMRTGVKINDEVKIFDIEVN